MSTLDKWNEFNVAWPALLKKHRVEAPFHMTDFYAGKGRYAAFRDDEIARHAFYMDAVRLFRDLTHKPIGYAIETADSTAVHAAYDLPDGPYPPYAWCSMSASWLAVLAAHRHRQRRGERTTMQFFFENGDADKGHFMRLMRLYLGREDPITFLDKGAPPLQAADMLAWVVGRAHRGPTADEQPKQPEVRLMLEIEQCLPRHDLFKKLSLERAIAWCETNKRRRPPQP